MFKRRESPKTGKVTYTGIGFDGYNWLTSKPVRIGKITKRVAEELIKLNAKLHGRKKY